MRNWKKFAALLLALVLVLSLCACGAKEPESELYGTWKYTLDLAAAIDKELEDQLGDALTVDADLELPVTFTFQKDKTFSLVMDGADLKTSFSVYLDALKDSVVELIYSQAVEMDMTREDFDAAFDEIYGMTVADYCGQLMDSLLDDSLIEELATNDTGVYRVKDGKLYVAATEGELSEDVYLTYTVEGDNLTISSVEGGALDLDQTDMGFPVTFVKEGSAAK